MSRLRIHVYLNDSDNDSTYGHELVDSEVAVPDSLDTATVATAAIHALSFLHRKIVDASEHGERRLGIELLSQIVASGKKPATPETPEPLDSRDPAYVPAAGEVVDQAGG